MQTPVLFLVFNRPDSTRQVFEAIREAQPPRFYVAADGLREGRKGEAERVAEVREIATAVDWDCEVKTLFRKSNLGCKYAVSGAITWFFEHEEMGIILEDDCLPSQSFFRFCEELLIRYKDEHRVSSISGSNPFNYGQLEDESESYFFSKYNRIWGWATWRRAWKFYDVELSLWPEVKKKKGHYVFFESDQERRHYQEIFDNCYSGKIDTWDFQWFFTKKLLMSLTLVSSKNLVKNIGSGGNATHTKCLPKEIASAPLEELKYPITHPASIIVDYRKDEYTMKFRFSSGVLGRIKKTIKYLLCNIFVK